MSKPIAPNDSLQALIDDGLAVYVEHGHLFVERVPYVNQKREVTYGTLICQFNVAGQEVLPPTTAPDTHQVWWCGEFPCDANGTPMHAQMQNEQGGSLFEGCAYNYRFSNKDAAHPLGFPTHYLKVRHYVTLIQGPARAIDPHATAYAGTAPDRAIQAPPSVFKYEDTCSSKAGIYHISAKLAAGKVAIIGLGGTGSYILDQVAKTHAPEIHLFDGDIFGQHTAFRSPGAASRDQVHAQILKVEYYQKMYEAMRNGIVVHPYRVGSDRLDELASFSFVFVAIDNDRSRTEICRFLTDRGIPFVDAGIGILKSPDGARLFGACRATLGAPGDTAHLAAVLPTDGAEANDNVYDQNIQVADMNALNAQLAVILWKQHVGFYARSLPAKNLTYTLDTNSLARD